MFIGENCRLLLKLIIKLYLITHLNESPDNRSACVFLYRQWPFQWLAQQKCRRSLQ